MSIEVDGGCSVLDKSGEGEAPKDDGLEVEVSDVDKRLLENSDDIAVSNVEENVSRRLELEEDSSAVEETEMPSEVEESEVEGNISLEDGVMSSWSAEVESKLELATKVSENVLNGSEVVFREEKKVMLELEGVKSSLEVMVEEAVEVMLRSPELPRVDGTRLVGEIVVVKLETTNPGQSRTWIGQHAVKQGH